MSLVPGPERGGDTLATPLKEVAFSTYSVAMAEIIAKPIKSMCSTLVSFLLPLFSLEFVSVEIVELDCFPFRICRNSKSLLFISFDLCHDSANHLGFSSFVHLACILEDNKLHLDEILILV